jgi:hypothetical protein
MRCTRDSCLIGNGRFRRAKQNERVSLVGRIQPVVSGSRSHLRAVTLAALHEWPVMKAQRSVALSTDV